MFRCPDALRPRALFIAAVVVGSCNSIAVAQESGMGAARQADQITSSPEVVIITTPRPSRSTIGAPIQDVSLSAGVRTDDLNLQSPADMIELRDRVWQTAFRLCRRLRFQHPIGVPDEFRCRRNAMEGASDQIDAIIVNYGMAPGTENP